MDRMNVNKVVIGVIHLGMARITLPLRLRAAKCPELVVLNAPQWNSALTVGRRKRGFTVEASGTQSDRY